MWDVAARGRVDVSADAIERDARRAEAVAYFEAHKEEAMPFDVTATELTALVPSYAPNGRLTIGYQFTTGAPYAFSDGLWASYTISTVRPSSALSARFAPYRDAPAQVRALLRARPAATLGGWSHVDAARDGG